MTQPMSDEVRATIAAALRATRMRPYNLTNWDEAHKARTDTALEWLTQQAAQPPRVQPDAHLTAWCEDALEVIARGVELMPLEQLSQWTGVRHVQESYDAALRGDYLSQPATAQESSDAA